MSRVGVDGVYGEVAGAGPAVVLTHDGLLHSESWDAQSGVLAAEYRVARWDRRGYGRSPRPSEPYSSVEDLAGVVRAVSDGPATLVGCSFGGLVTELCALEHPDLVAALVLVGPIVSGLPFSEHFNTRGGRELPGLDASVEEWISYWAQVDPWFIGPDNVAARERLRELLTANPQNLRPPAELERALELPAALPRLGGIGVPTLIVAGEQDVPDVHAHCGAIEAAIPGARRVVLAGSGHLPHLEVPDAFNAVLLEFLADVRKQASAG